MFGTAVDGTRVRITVNKKPVVGEYVRYTTLKMFWDSSSLKGRRCTECRTKIRKTFTRKIGTVH